MNEKSNAIRWKCMEMTEKLDTTCSCSKQKRKDFFHSILCMNTGVIGASGMRFYEKLSEN